jgi:hypothetical protein
MVLAMECVYQLSAFFVALAVLGGFLVPLNLLRPWLPKRRWDLKRSGILLAADGFGWELCIFSP